MIGLEKAVIYRKYFNTGNVEISISHIDKNLLVITGIHNYHKRIDHIVDFLKRYKPPAR